MRAATVIAVTLATFSSFPLTAQQQQETPAQQQATPAQQTSPEQQQSAPSTDQANQAAKTGAVAEAVQLQPVNGELVGKLDSKTSKTGDSVVIKTKESVKTADGTEIPKGSKLMGTVTGVQARGEGKENSQIAIKFDHAELKGGQNVAIESVIQSMAPAEVDSSTSSAGSDGGAMPGSTPGGNSGGAQPNGANKNPEMNRDTVNGNTSGNREGATATTAAGETSRPADSSPAPGSIVARSGNVAIRMTAIPGVLLANNANGQPFANASGILLGARRDVHLDGGTQVVIALAMMPGGGASGGGMSR